MATKLKDVGSIEKIISEMTVEEKAACITGCLLYTSTEEVIAYILQHPEWRLSLQTHKLLQIP